MSKKAQNIEIIRSKDGTKRGKWKRKKQTIVEVLKTEPKLILSAKQAIKRRLCQVKRNRISVEVFIDSVRKKETVRYCVVSFEVFNTQTIFGVQGNWHVLDQERFEIVKEIDTERLIEAIEILNRRNAKIKTRAKVLVG